MSKEPDQHRLLPSSAGDSEDDLGLSQHEVLGRRKKSRWFAKSCFFASVFVVACIASFWVGTRVSMRKASVDQECAAYASQWCKRPQVGQQQGSPEVDEAWEDLGVNYRAGIISYEDGLASGLNPYFVQRAAKYGGGFLVNVEGMHHLHCLVGRFSCSDNLQKLTSSLQNLVRKSLYFNYDHYKQLGEHEFVNEDVILRPHISRCLGQNLPSGEYPTPSKNYTYLEVAHCLDAIRQVLMCNVDTGVLGQVWANSEKPFPFPDFNTNHRFMEKAAMKAVLSLTPSSLDDPSTQNSYTSGKPLCLYERTLRAKVDFELSLAVIIDGTSPNIFRGMGTSRVLCQPPSQGAPFFVPLRNTDNFTCWAIRFMGTNREKQGEASSGRI
ncbi:hypothetical protein MAC_02325 [Metarhizium acridum CQMa 102]|uniref:Tat pathway signal sequence n=1 Tax=Metarhizium acridum (strain CQMa 102) TaxID=655827 RepID=E9DXH7_METAQ|nr:uncharacterized protein MAC_02325 [Metarhizium acridum CQMa 102]EFY91735.1 hypothetical protein MAC_02325 [Metarhizium acridum CQMa 102]